MRIPCGILLAPVVAAVMAGAAAAQMGGPMSVYLEPVEVRAVRQSVELTGTAEARRASLVSAETAGRVEKMRVDAGDAVAAGAPLCELRRLPVELQLRQAEALLASAQAQLKKAETGFRPEEIQQADARVKAAQAGFERWTQEYERTRRLLVDGASTPAERDVVESAYRQAKEQLAEAEAYLALVKAGNRIEDIDNARAQMAAQAAAVESLKDTLAKMTVRMPFDGFVIRKRCEEGEWLAAGLPVAEVADLAVLRVQVDLPERYLAGLAKGAKAPVVFDALGDREFPGILSQIVPQSAEGTHTVPVRVDVANTLENSRPLIAAGLFAKVWIPVGAEHQALLVPKAAVIRQEGRDLVYTVADAPPGPAAGGPPPAAAPPAAASDAAKATAPPPNPAIAQAGPIRFAVAIPVRIVEGHGRYMEVESDRLQAGMMLVTRGTYQMAPGTPVWVRPKEQGGPAQPTAAPTAGADAAGTSK